MRRFLYMVSAFAALTSCAGVQGDDQTDFEPMAPYTLTTDKTVVESDGQDAATLKIIDANGVELTTAEHIRNASFNIVGTDQWLTAMGTGNQTPNVFSFISDGEHTIRAMYNGVFCENTVTVTSRNRASYEVFHKNVAIYRLTATWCQYCPDMTVALSGVDAYTKDHSVIMSFHNGDSYSVYPGTEYDCAALLLQRFNHSGLPYCIYALSEGADERKVKGVQELVKKYLYEAPACTGIKASVAVQDNTITVNAAVKASSPGEYDLGWAVLEDNLRPGGNANEEKYDNVVRAVSGNFYAMSADKFTLAADQEYEKTLTWTNPIVGTAAQDLKVALFTLVNRNGKVVIDNIIAVRAGSSADYRMNSDE